MNVYIYVYINNNYDILTVKSWRFTGLEITSSIVDQFPPQSSNILGSKPSGFHGVIPHGVPTIKNATG